MTRSSEFDFWDEQGSKASPIRDGFPGSELVFQTKRHVEDGFGTYSPPLWKKGSWDIPREASPLLPDNRYYSFPSSTARLQAIADGRRELMEMIKDLPESSYELSLKDIVDDQQKEEGNELQRSQKYENEVKIPQKRKQTRGSRISRTESMDNGVFLLKMFFPISLSCKKKSKVRNRPKVSPDSSAEKCKYKDWWKIIFLAERDNKSSRNISRSKSDITGNKSSWVESNFMPDWRSSNAKKYKSRGKRGCLF